MVDRPIVVGAASRPYPGETENGDAWTVQWHGSLCRIALIDGLGHGPSAAEAAQIAVGVLASHADLSPADAIQACHQALRGSRGAVIYITVVDTRKSELTHASVGNVEAHLLQSGKTQRLIGARGIVGVALPAVRSFVVGLDPEWLLLLHTDGVSARVALENVPEAHSASPEQLAAVVLDRWGRATDDATVLVARVTSSDKEHERSSP